MTTAPRLNRRHKAGLFLTIVLVGLGLLAGMPLGEGVGCFLLGVAVTWGIGALSRRAGYVLALAVTIAMLIGLLVVADFLRPDKTNDLIGYALVVAFAALLSLLLFEWRVYRRWNGPQLGHLSRRTLFEGLQKVVADLRLALKEAGPWEASCVADVAKALDLAPVSPDGVTFAQAVEIRCEVGKVVDDFGGELVPAGIQQASEKAYTELTNVMRRTAYIAGMKEQFERAEGTGYNLRQMTTGKTADEIFEPLTNPISRPQVLKVLGDTSENFPTAARNLDIPYLLREARRFNRTTEALEPYFSPYRWIGGVGGGCIGWVMTREVGGIIVGAIIGQFSGPRLMRSVTILHLLYPDSKPT